MPLEDVTALGLYVGGAIAFSAAAVLALAVAAALERRWRLLVVPALYLVNVVYESIAPLLGGRELLLTEGIYEPGGAAKWLTRFIILVTLTLCAARLVGAAFSGENRNAGGEGLFFAFAVYFLTSVVLSGAFGRYPEFKHDQYYVPFLFAAVYASRAQDPETALRFAKAGFFIFIAASWLAALVVPDMVMVPDQRRWIPGLTVRFWGLENSPNSMGPVALVYLLLALHQPFANRWLQRLGLILGIAALVAAQSKTAWIAAALSIPVLLVLRYRARRVAAFSILGLGAAVAIALFALPMIGVSLEELAHTQQGHEALTFSGRGAIWALAMREWTHDPLFGYGLGMWDEAYRQRLGMDWAVSAHNQFLQTLSVAGTAGVIGLALYLGALSLYAVRAGRGSRGLSIVLLIVVLVDCATEAPLTITSFLGGEFVAQLLLFQLALAYGRKAGRRALYLRTA